MKNSLCCPKSGNRKIDACICANCGYTEWFAQDFEALEED